MRQTKAELLRRIEVIETFHRMPVKFVPLQSVHTIRNKRWFVPTVQYSVYPIAAGEFGMVGSVRYRTESRGGI